MVSKGNRILVALAALTLVAAGVTAACSGFSSEDAEGNPDGGGDAARDDAGEDGESGTAALDASGDAGPSPYSTNQTTFSCDAGYDGPPGGKRLACLDFDDGTTSNVRWSTSETTPLIGLALRLAPEAGISPPHAVAIESPPQPDGAAPPATCLRMATLTDKLNEVGTGHWIIRAMVRPPKQDIDLKDIVFFQFNIGAKQVAGASYGYGNPDARWTTWAFGKLNEPSSNFIKRPPDDAFFQVSLEVKTSIVDDAGVGQTVLTLSGIDAGVESITADFTFNPTEKNGSYLGFGERLNSHTEDMTMLFDNVTVDKLP